MSGLNKTRVLGVLAGRDMSGDKVLEWARSAEIVLAADGGANLLYENGFIADVALGDFDSINNSTKDAQKNLVYLPDQDHSDCDKLLEQAERRGYREITLCGVEGDLMDHLLGTMQSAASSNLLVRFAFRRGTGFILKGPLHWEEPVSKGARLSLLPLTECLGVTLKGVQWELTDSELSVSGMKSLSNCVTGQVAIDIHSGIAVLFLTHPSLEMPHWH